MYLLHALYLQGEQNIVSILMREKTDRKINEESAKKNLMGSDGAGRGATLDKVSGKSVLFEKVKFDLSLENEPVLKI